jgi:choline dehydrogenase-like flavoprotein
VSVYKSIETLSNGIELPSDEYLECAVRHTGEPSYHMVGTCKMGPSNDPMAVVSPKLKVYNVSGLRVIDASIMPSVMCANTHAPTVMIGERGAQFIKHEYNLK